MRGRSIRVRIALWYTAVFAPFFAVLAFAAYSFVAFTSQERVDEFLAESAATIAAAIEFERKLGAPDSVAMASVVASMRLPDVAVHVVDATSGRDFTTPAGGGGGRPPREARAMELSPALAAALARTARAAPRDPAVVTLEDAGKEVRVLTLPYALATRQLVIAVAQGMNARARTLRDARWALAIGFPLVMAIATLGGVWLAGKSLAPVDAMAAQARQIGATNLHQRLPVSDTGDELARLATVFNGLLARLEEAFEAQSRFAADASHEMRTPVAIISGEAEHALARDDRARNELREALYVIRDQSLRLRAVVDDLFFLARADSGEPMLRPAPLYLRDVLEEAVRGLRTVAAARSITMQLADSDDAPVVGDESLLRRAVDNLLVNAVKYSHPGGTVDVSLADCDGDWCIDVRDSGPGVSPPAQVRLFERFFRAHEAPEVRSVDGAGLGLAIARWIARAHRGEALLASSSASGSTFRLRLPKAHEGAIAGAPPA
ncbi:MAG: hypothetical protein ABS52_08605 [Gemmatimonadetes bacterium SCN 70-22]|nr:MAG: hypothetical protein ABS52_08605 [Gemmatimonadetes bacterium SCN 70-22]